MTSWKTEEDIALMEAIKNKSLYSFRTIEGKEYIVLRPHASITTVEPLALSAYVELKAKVKNLKESLKEELAQGDVVNEQSIRDSYKREYDGLLNSYHTAYRKAFGEEIECVIHIQDMDLEEKMELTIELYPHKSDGMIYDVINLGFVDENKKEFTRPCIVLEVKDIEG